MSLLFSYFVHSYFFLTFYYWKSYVAPKHVRSLRTAEPACFLFGARGLHSWKISRSGPSTFVIVVRVFVVVGAVVLVVVVIAIEERVKTHAQLEPPDNPERSPDLSG